jgi:hypothetical protein
MELRIGKTIEHARGELDAEVPGYISCKHRIGRT